MAEVLTLLTPPPLSARERAAAHGQPQPDTTPSSGDKIAGGVGGSEPNKFLLARLLHPPSLNSLQDFRDGAYPPPNEGLVPRRVLARGDSLVDESPHGLQDPHVFPRIPSLRLWGGPP